MFQTIGHTRGLPCPRCKKDTFCDDCAMCEVCHFALPDVAEIPYPEWPLPMPMCDECGGTPVHARTCSTTQRSAIGPQ
jgi:hypothetical protein